jgi:peptide/nickel transport system substrate-binding protein
MKVCVVAALTALVLTAGPATAGDRSPSRSTPAAAPLAQAWANVPRTTAGRKAARIAVFGVQFDVTGGFNTVLNCCSAIGSAWLGYVEALRGAFVQNDKGVWVKDLVTSASATKTGVSYTISPTAFWYWGGRRLPVTYRDFVYTLQQIDDPKSDVVSRVGYGNLDPTRFTHSGDRQVTFFWKTTSCSTDYPCGPYANWQLLFSNLYPAAALAGLDFNTIWTSCICGNDGKPVADGPFYLASYRPGQGSKLKANPFWGGKKPSLSEIDLKVITDTTIQAEAMQSGALDAIAPSFGGYLLPLEHAPGITFETVPGYFIDFLEFREGDVKAAAGVTRGSSNVLLRAPWMREAIALAIDRQSIIDALFPGSGLRPLDSLLYFASEAGYSPDFARWNYNAAEALAILKAHCTGGPRKPDPNTDKIWQCAGLPATFRWTWGAGQAARTQAEAIAKSDLKAVGIALTERPLPPDVIFGPNGIPSGDFDIADFGYYTSGDPGDLYDQYRCYGDGNYTGYCSHRVDQLLRQANGELDPAKRAPLYRAADAIMATQVPVLPLYQKPAPLIHKSDLLGMRANPGVAGPFWNVEDWHWKR